MDDRKPPRLYVNTPSILFQDEGAILTIGPQTSHEDRAVLLWALRKKLVDLELDTKVTVKVSKVPYR